MVVIINKENENCESDNERGKLSSSSQENNKHKYKYLDEIKIPKERVAVVIGKSGSTKKEIEKNTKSKLIIDSNEGTVKFFSDDPITILQLKDIITAIGRGFNPRIALNLLKTDYVLEVIDVSDFGKTKKAKTRLKGRVIGEDGKARRTVENLTETDISVYGKTISIIGEIGQVSIAKRAVLSLLSGSPHSRVYSWLEKKRKELKHREMIALLDRENLFKEGFDNQL